MGAARIKEKETLTIVISGMRLLGHSPAWLQNYGIRRGMIRSGQKKIKIFAAI